MWCDTFMRMHGGQKRASIRISFFFFALSTNYFFLLRLLALSLLIYTYECNIYMCADDECRLMNVLNLHINGQMMEKNSHKIKWQRKKISKKKNANENKLVWCDVSKFSQIHPYIHVTCIHGHVFVYAPWMNHRDNVSSSIACGCATWDIIRSVIVMPFIHKYSQARI